MKTNSAESSSSFFGLLESVSILRISFVSSSKYSCFLLSDCSSFSESALAVDLLSFFFPLSSSLFSLSLFSLFVISFSFSSCVVSISSLFVISFSFSSCVVSISSLFVISFSFFSCSSSDISSVVTLYFLSSVTSFFFRFYHFNKFLSPYLR